MRRLFTLALLAFVTACTPIWYKPAEPAEVLWQQRLAQQAAMGDWAFRGRTAITQGREGWNAGIDWQDRGETFTIRLSGPFAQGGVELEGAPDAVSLTLDDGEVLTAATPEQLLADALGWLLPVSALRDWVRGVPYSALPVDGKQLDEHGRAVLLEQAGWKIEFLEYMPFEGVSMPAKVFMKHPDLSVRLIVLGWRRPL